VPTNDTASPTRRTVVELLKRYGPLTVAELGRRLGVSAVAVRRHLEQLERDGLVVQTLQPSSRGRPAHLYSLTAEGHERFPRAYDQLALHLLGAACSAFGDGAVEALFARRQRLLADTYRERVAAALADGDAGIAGLARELAAIQDENGYMAASVDGPDGPEVREHNCAIGRVAAEHPMACDYELRLLQELAGPEVMVERIAHLQAGDQHCAYRLARRRGP
jgi:predicted ArsR family transcriptional regulator